MRSRRTVRITSLVVTLVGLVFSAPSLQAITFYCSDCDCNITCNKSCTDDSTGLPSTCGAAGVCIGMCGVAGADLLRAGTPAGDPGKAFTAWTAATSGLRSRCDLGSFLALTPAPPAAPAQSAPAPSPAER